ncbi:MAG: hypothetical protein HY791_13405 [Deltaproteobacteria bacterium]|nr:hypothetical protein [Deltaproteobacteria bacterium]
MLAGCSHAAPPGPTWPAAEAARFRWAGSLPSPDATERSLASRIFAWILGTEGDPALRLERPFGVAAGGGSVWVSEPDARRVTRFELPDGDAQAVECGWVRPMGLAWSGDSLLVADAGAGVVVRVGPHGCQPLGAGSLVAPVGVAATSSVTFVADAGQRRVLAFDLLGRLRLDFAAEARGVFGAVASGPGGLYAIDLLTFEILRLDATGAPRQRLEEPSVRRGDPSANRPLGRPKGVAVDGAGAVFVTDAEAAEVLVFGPDGRFELTFSGPGVGPGKLAVPAGIAVADGFVFVVDTFRGQLELFEILQGGLP